MAASDRLEHMLKSRGFIAALDQSGGTTPRALQSYGVFDTEYSGEEEMFALIHQMRARIMSAPAFTGDRIMGTILFWNSMEDRIDGIPVPEYLWSNRGVLPFLKVDVGLADEENGVCLMSPIPDLEQSLEIAVSRGMFGTKMRSVINRASPSGIHDIVMQQFKIAKVICKFDLIPIVEPEVSIGSEDKRECEKLLVGELTEQANRLMPDQKIALKLTLPEERDLYSGLVAHEQVTRVSALSGGYSQTEACERLASNKGMIASFSRALTEGLNKSQSGEEFCKTLEDTVQKIFLASCT